MARRGDLVRLRIICVACRVFYQQPSGSPGEKLDTDTPGVVNIPQNPFERTRMAALCAVRRIVMVAAGGAWLLGGFVLPR